MPNVEEVQLQHKDASIFKSGATKAEPEKTLTKPFIRAQEKIGRNEPCP